MMHIPEEVYVLLPIVAVVVFISNLFILKHNNNDIPPIVFRIATMELMTGVLIFVSSWIFVISHEKDEQSILSGISRMLWMFSQTLQTLTILFFSLDRILNASLQKVYSNNNISVDFLVVASSSIFCCFILLIGLEFSFGKQLQTFRQIYMASMEESEYVTAWSSCILYITITALVLSILSSAITSLKFSRWRWSYNIEKHQKNFLPMYVLCVIKAFLMTFSISNIVTIELDEDSYLIAKILSYAFVTCIVQPIFLMATYATFRCWFNRIFYKFSITVIEIDAEVAGGDQMSQGGDRWSSMDQYVGQMGMENHVDRANRERSVSFYNEVHNFEDIKMQNMNELREKRKLEKQERRKMKLDKLAIIATEEVNNIPDGEPLPRSPIRRDPTPIPVTNSQFLVVPK